MVNGNNRSMSKLRKQLQQANRDYSALRYPGDLSADVLDQMSPPVRSHWIRNVAIAAGVALAATAAFVAFNRTDRSSTNGTNSVVVDPKSTPSPNELPSSNANEPVTIAQDDSRNGIESADGVVEESWALSPTQVASAEESSMSIVPGYESISFGLPSMSISGIDAYVEQEQTEINTVQ